MQIDENGQEVQTQDDENILTQNTKQDSSEQEIKQQQVIFNDIDNDQPIFIVVINPQEIIKTQVNRYLVYTIKGKDAFGSFEVQRRFNEFYILREALITSWPGLYIPPIPEKIVNPSGEVLLERIRILNLFVMKMSQIKYLYYSEEFCQIFLRSQQSDICKEIQALPKANISSQIEKYKHIFELNEFDLSCLQNVDTTKINGIQQFFKKSQQLLYKLNEQTKQLSMSRKQYKDQFHLFFGYGLYEFEQVIIKPCVENEKQLLFCNPIASEVKSTLEYLKEQQLNALDKIQDLITIEQRDMDAFIAGFQSREQILGQKIKIEQKLKSQQEQLAKIVGGNVNLQDQKQKLELQIIESQNNVEQIKLYYQLVTYVLTNKAIEKFKSDKHLQYKLIMKDLAKQEIEHNQIMTEIWARIISIVEELNKE